MGISILGSKKEPVTVIVLLLPILATLVSLTRNKATTKPLSLL